MFVVHRPRANIGIDGLVVKRKKPSFLVAFMSRAYSSSSSRFTSLSIILIAARGPNEFTGTKRPAVLISCIGTF